MKLIVAIICLTLCVSAGSAHAELQYQQNMEQFCRPANPSTYMVTRWKEQCTNDCFQWRLTCSNGKAVTLQSPIHPRTTRVQWTFHHWAPWSLAAYFLPIVGYAVLALIGARWLLPQLLLNGILIAYAGYAGWSYYSSVTGNPLSSMAGIERTFFLNGYVYGAVMVAFVILNLPSVIRSFELFYRHRVAAAVPVLWSGYPSDAAAMRTALMPNLHEFIDPREGVAHYHRQTEQVRALKEKLDADVALAEAVIRRERIRRELHDQDRRV